jgi:hypothetical protein
MYETIIRKDREILRNLAKKQLEIAHSDKMKKLYAEWHAHGSFASGSRPMITVELVTFENEIIPPLMQCESETARKIEWKLHSNIVNHTLFHDDSVVKDYYDLRWATSFVPFGIELRVEHAKSENKESLGHHFLSGIQDLHEDFYKLKASNYTLNKEYTLKYKSFVDEILGDIFLVKLEGGCQSVSLTQNLVHIMSMENMFISMYDYPDEFKLMMDMQTNDYLKFFDYIEMENVLSETTGEQWLNQGSYCFTNELPNQKKHFTTKDIWGYMDSQETVGVSADMFNEFMYPYYKKIADRFGLISYGCCEPVDPIYEKCISNISNLKKISISAWCNEQYMGEQLKNKRIIYLRKPRPNYLGVGTNLDEDEIKKHINTTIKAAKGCQLEFSTRDVYSVNHSPDKVKRYIEIIRECCQ